MGNKVFVRLPGGGRARILTEEMLVEKGKLVLGNEFVSHILGKGHKPDPDGIVRIPIKSSKEIQ